MQYRRSGLVILAVCFLALLAGIALMIGRAENDSPVVRALGAGLVLGTATVLFLTARRWAGYFFAACVIATIKASFSLLFGVTISVPRLVTNRVLVSILLCLLIAMAILTFRFVTTLPKSNLQALSLVSAVVGLAWAILIEPNVWPLWVSVAVLSISWLLERLLRAHRIEGVGHGLD
jgi:hypothetical protein